MKDSSAIGELVWSFDEYFESLLEIPKVNLNNIRQKYFCRDARNLEQFLSLQEVYYYLIRQSVAVIPAEDASEEQFRRDEQSLFQRFLGWSYYLADQHVETGRGPEPGWVTLLLDEVQEHCDKDVAALLSTLPITVDMSNSQIVVAKAGHTPRIEISAILKPLFANYCQIVHLFLADGCRAALGPAKCFEFLFPYALHSTHSIKPTRLPRLTTMDKRQYWIVTSLAHVQTLFLLLHELAHIALGHTVPDGHARGYLQMETEADAFACSLAAGWPDSEIETFHLGLEILFGYHTVMVDSANRILATTQPKSKPRQNFFAQRHNALRKTIPLLPSLRREALALHEFFEVYRNQLSNMQDSWILDTIRKYTSWDDNDRWIDLLSE